MERGDVVFNRTSETQEEVGLGAVYIGVEPVVFGGFVIRGRPKESNTLDATYVGYSLRAALVRQQIIQRGQGVIRANIGQADLRTVTVPHPRIEEQRAIAAALSDVDALIGALDRLISKKRDLKQAAMQQLLTGQTRLPGFSEKWAELNIAGVVRNIIDYRGRTPRKLGMHWGGGRIRALSALNVKMGYLDLDADAYFGSEALYQRWMTNGDCKKGDLLFTTEAPLGNVALIPDEEKYILSQRTVLLQLKPEVAVSAFLIQLMMSRPFQKVLADNATGSTASGIKRAKLEQLSIALPDTSEQTAIAAVLSDMDAEITATEQRRDKTRLLKQGMMQELLTGRTRLV